MKNKTATLWVTTGIITIGLLILALFGMRGQTFCVSTAPQDFIEDTDVWVAASISKETLLLLLAIGIAGALGLSRKRKGIEKGTQQSQPDDPSDP
jgi:hypothetical protein